MDNIFSLLRFAIPGAFFVLQIGLFYIINTECLTSTIDLISKSGVFQITTTVIILITVGFSSSLIYRLCFTVHLLNHTDAINYLINNRCIDVIGSDNCEVPSIEVPQKNPLKNLFKPWIFLRIMKSNRKNRIDSYQILTVIWHDHKSLFDIEKGSYQGHLINSFGSAMFAIGLGIILTAIPAIFCIDRLGVNIGFFVINFCFLIAVTLTWNQTRRLYSQWIESSIISQIAALVKRRKGRSIQIKFFKRFDTL